MAIDLANSPLKAVNGVYLDRIKIAETDDGRPIYLTDKRVIPNKFDWQIEDVSQSTAGRTESGKMLKQTVRANVMSIGMAWQNIPFDLCKEILKMFQIDSSGGNEYFNMTYYDFMTNQVETKLFYVGNRQISEYNHKLGIISELSFNVILV